MFGARPCCADDLRLYVRALDSAAIQTAAAAARELPAAAAAEGGAGDGEKSRLQEEVCQPCVAGM
jgi:hypothetical protein